MADADYKPPQDTRWIDIQKRTFTRWANNFLLERMMKIEDLGRDLSDGLLLINLLEIISSKQIPNYNKKPKIRAQKLENTGACLQFLKNEGIKLVAIGPEDITDMNLKLILGLIWTIILRYQIARISGASGSAKNDLLEWVRKKIPECDVTNFTGSWQDGRAVCHLTEALKPGAFTGEHGPLNNLVGRPNLENATKGEEAAEKELGIPQILAPEDMVAAADELSTMTYISYFRDYEANEGKRRAAELAARTADPSKCIAYGPGLEHAETGIPAEFTIQARNAAGANIPVGGENFEVKVQGASPNVPVHVVDNGNGTYGVTYTASHPGKHSVSVQLKGKPISGSPWSVPVDRAPVDVTQTLVHGPGVDGPVTQGEPGVFTIESRDRLGQRIKFGGDPYKVTLKGPHREEEAPRIVDNHDGSYTVTYVPVDYGKHQVAVTLENRHVAKSPYEVNVSKPKGYPDALQCYADGPGLKGGNTAEPAVFTVYARDSNGNPVVPRENPFLVEITQPDGSDLPAQVKDNRDGTYTVTYAPTEVGKHEIVVGLKNPVAPQYWEHIKDSPFHVGIVPGTDASKSRVYGPGIEEGVQDNLPTHFTIEARDRNGNPMREGGDPFEVRVNGPRGEVPVEVKDNGDGTYTVSYAPEHAGNHRIDVSLKNKPVANSPYNVNVREGADHNTSFIESYQFVIRARTKTGKDMQRGGEKFEVKASGPSGQVPVKLQDAGNGTYVVNYSIPPSKGAFTFEVKVNGHNIQGSPFTHEH
jgi:filamin